SAAVRVADRLGRRLLHAGLPRSGLSRSGGGGPGVANPGRAALAGLTGLARHADRGTPGSPLRRDGVWARAGFAATLFWLERPVGQEVDPLDVLDEQRPATEGTTRLTQR